MLKSKRTILIGVAAFSLIAQNALADPIIISVDDAIEDADLQWQAERKTVEAPEDDASPVTLVQARATTLPYFPRPVPHGPVVGVAVTLPWPTFGVGPLYYRVRRHHYYNPRRRFRAPHIQHRTIPRSHLRRDRRRGSTPPARASSFRPAPRRHMSARAPNRRRRRAPLTGSKQIRQPNTRSKPLDSPIVPAPF